MHMPMIHQPTICLKKYIYIYTPLEIQRILIRTENNEKAAR